MAQILIVVSAYIFLLMGVAHAALTLRDLRQPRAFTPRDATLRLVMQQSSIALHPTINLWNAWLGFSMTHSLGLALFGGGFLYVGVMEPQAFAASWLLPATAVLVSAIYLVVSIRFFFAKPAVGSALGLVGFVLATVLAYA